MSISRKLRDMFHDMTRTCLRISLDLDGYRTPKMIHDSRDPPIYCPAKEAATAPLRRRSIGRQLDFLKANTRKQGLRFNRAG